MDDKNPLDTEPGSGPSLMERMYQEKMGLKSEPGTAPEAGGGSVDPVALWEGATRRSVRVVDITPRMKKVIAAVAVVAITMVALGGVLTVALLIPGILLLVTASGFALTQVRIFTVDRTTRMVTMRLAILPFIAFGYPLGAVRIKLLSHSAQEFGYEYHSVWFGVDEEEMRAQVAGGLYQKLKPFDQRILLSPTLAPARDLHARLDALLTPPTS